MACTSLTRVKSELLQCQVGSSYYKYERLYISLIGSKASKCENNIYEIMDCKYNARIKFKL